MSYIDESGNLKTADITKLIRQVAKSVDDTLYHSFENIKPEERVKVSDAIESIRNLANIIESQEDEFFST